MEKSRNACGIYPQAFANISVKALPLLVWQRITSALHLAASLTAQRTILCDTVLVNRTTRSGLPIWSLRLPVM